MELPEQFQSPVALSPDNNPEQVVVTKSIDADNVPAEKRRMLPDFFYAGYHRGEKPLPAKVPGAIYDITTYGATPDDESDDTGAIQRAIDAAGEAKGGVVLVPKGEFRVQSPSPQARAALLIWSSGVVLRGVIEEGKLVSKILNTSTQMRDKQVIQLYPRLGGSWYTESKDQNNITKLREDILLPTPVLPVESVAPFKVGDWVIVSSSTTNGFVHELGMGTEKYAWKPGNPQGQMFCRQITAVNSAARTVSIDVPTRYALKLRDNARIYPASPMIQDAGVENLQMAMLENETPGWGGLDFNVAGTGAYQVHNSSLIVVQGAVNCWVRRVETYHPIQNTLSNVSNPKGDFNILSYGIRTPFSRGVTVADCVVSNPQYRGEGGNGYGYVLEGNDCLFVNCVANNARHSFSFKQMKSNGNVIYNCTSNTPSLASDYHMHLSMANLFDNMTLNGDFIDVGIRPWGGKPLHGVTTSQSVFWNTRGLSRAVQASPSLDVEVETGVADANGIMQPDWVEGAPCTDDVDDSRSSDNLQPASLYANQLQRRLAAGTR